ncbi:MAG: hypothetical protein K2I88_07110, partial [Anaeroplasmataceae bacterium]|nr:hypothetical protein [Anaeroplasmataceae bacterium]
IYPNIKLSNADYQTINAARTAVKKVYNDQVAKWLKAGTAVSDKDWNAFVAAMEKAGTKTIVATLQKYVK